MKRAAILLGERGSLQGHHLELLLKEKIHQRKSVCLQRDRVNFGASWRVKQEDGERGKTTESWYRRNKLFHLEKIVKIEDKEKPS